MFQKSTRAICLAASLAAGLMTLSTAPASANSLSFGITVGTPGYRGDYYEPRRIHRPRGQFRQAAVCAPARALRKAQRLGIHRPHLVRANRRVVVVAGRSYGDRSVVRFAQQRNCPVISFRRR